ncbi:MAG: hypothetical protein HKN85_05005 [Gammaproteobacteria bacterium]|nr:hypothetical protein [Gammaproteobacteria bacterium]
MRLILTIAAFCAVVPAQAQEPFVTVLGVKLVRGMAEADVRAAFPNIRCSGQEAGFDPGYYSCSLDGGQLPGVDGGVTFKDGHVLRASRNWFPEDDASPYEVLNLQNQILTRLAGEDTAACTKVETHAEQYSTSTMFAFPDKVLTVRMHSRVGNSVFFTESLRVNPVPDSQKVRGDKMQGDEWCAYIN